MDWSSAWCSRSFSVVVLRALKPQTPHHLTTTSLMAVLVACLSDTVGTGRISSTCLPLLRKFLGTYSSVKSSWNDALNSWVFSGIHLHRENGYISIISCGYKPTNHCSLVGESPYNLGLSVCEKGTVTLFMLTLPSMHRRVACCCTYPGRMDRLGDIPFLKCASPKPTVCIVFQGKWSAMSSFQACP